MIAPKSILIIIILVLISFPASRAQTLSKEQREILEMQDGRSLGDGKLVSYIRSKDKDLRYRAAIALANLQDTSTIGDLLPLVLDEDVQIRGAAVFALGQIGTILAEKSLIGALSREQDIQVLPRLFEALGKCGDAEALNAVIAYIPSAKNIAVKRDQALGIARLAMRKITSERGVWLCFDLLKDNHSETRSAALYALWRSAPLGVIDLEISNRAYLLVKLMSDQETDVRINLATLLGRTKSEEAPRLIKMFQQVENQSPDWRVQVQLGKSAGLLARLDPSLMGPLLTYLDSQNDHVRIASMMTLASMDSGILSSSEHKEKLLATLKNFAASQSKQAPLVQGEAFVTLGRMFPNELSGIKALFDNRAAGNLLRSKYIEALSYTPTKENIGYVIGCLEDDSVRVAMSAWDFLIRMIQPRVLEAQRIDRAYVDSIPAFVVARMESGLRRKDLAVTSLVANVFADTSILEMCERAGYHRKIIDAFALAYSTLSSANDAEAMMSIQQTFIRLRDTSAVPALEKTLVDPNRTVGLGAVDALTRITGRNYATMPPNPSVIQRTENDWKVLESIKPSQRVSFRTSKGTFTVRLRKEVAPFTVLAFFKLVKQKFYNGLTFHRVVPGFVIQGGDPRGDGWGGAGFTVRSEWSLVDFERGSVGMASSGKDSEGCQFFITHVPTPHLDGRYTLFATVTSGMEVVDRIQVGDRILSAELR
jgi:cyclophilin family peptidyl-prolyl cis-trans isomerase/HEAT repeat protein